MSSNFPATNPRWNLDPLFEGGVESASFTEELCLIEDEVEKLAEKLKGLHLPREGSLDNSLIESWRDFFDHYFQTSARLSEAGSFSWCLASSHTDNAEALRMPSRLDDARTAFDGLEVEIGARFRGLADEVFESLLAAPGFESMQLWLREVRRDADQSMDPELEALVVELNRDGLHAWGRLYTQASGRLKVEVEVDGEVKFYSVGQAKNLLSSADRDLRRRAYEGLQKAWGSIAPICASALNSIIGGEQTLYRRRGGDCLTMPLQANRVEQESVEAIFEAAAEFRPLLVRYLQAKAKLLGLEKLAWYDLRAPVTTLEEEKIPYEEAQEFIVEQVHSFSPKIADFCRMALAERWVEAEDRPGKAQGGFCSSLHVSKEVRIFMTYGGTSTGVATLAHELGHGYHYWTMKDLPSSEQRVPMGLAETASTLLEALVEQAALRDAEGQRLLSLLDDRLGRAMAFLMDIPARYQLEKLMHERRARDTLHEEMLREMTRQVFGEHFGQGVEGVDELFWASKLHFFITQLPFYNFPYSFGYLFSRAVYDKAMEEGEEFIGQLDDLLGDTGRMTSEELARKYLDADLGDRQFWKSAAGSLEEDVRRFEEMVQATIAD